MKQLRILLPLLFIALCSAGQGIPKGKKKNTKIDSAGVFPNGVQKGPTKNAEIGTAEGKGVLLVYTGKISGSMNIDVGYHVEMDSLIGLRCDIVLESGQNVLSHTGIFYQFSSPDHTVFYDFRSHKSTINGYSSAPGDDPEFVVVGEEQVDSFTCTLVQHKDRSSIQNFWMSKQVPGYQSLMNVLKSIGAGLPGMAISGTIFVWGGLVKLNRTDTESDGRATTLHINLVEVNPNMSFPASDFDVPSQ